MKYSIECYNRHKNTYDDIPIFQKSLDIGGEYAFRQRGEVHAWTSDEVTSLQHAVRKNDIKDYKTYANLINDHSERMLTIRGLFRLKYADETKRKKLSLDQVEPAKDIVKRFSTGAMSLGSISAEAYENIAIAMNRIGGKSNTGEGGEESERFFPLNNGDSKRSAKNKLHQVGLVSQQSILLIQI